MSYNLPSERQFKELRAVDAPFCLTIYAPRIGSPGAVDPNRVELKNLLKQAEVALSSAGVTPADVKKTLRPARELLQAQTFWPVRYESLALFMRPGFFRYYRIPDDATPYLLTVEQGFNLGPLRAAMDDNQRYYLLALSHKGVSLYRGDHYQIEQLRPRHFPVDLKQALGIDEFPHWYETHTIAPASDGKGSEAYHGQYNISQTDKQMLLEFFRQIDRRLRTLLRKEPAPLLLAGVNYLLPIYRRANTYADLRPGGITGNVSRMDLDTLRERAWRLVGGAVA